MKDSDHVEAMKKGGKVVKKKTGKTRASATAIVNINMGRKASKTPTQPPRGPSQVSQLLGVVNALANRAVGGFFAEPNKPLSAVPQVPNVLNIQPEPNRPLSAIQPAPNVLNIQPDPNKPLSAIQVEQEQEQKEVETFFQQKKRLLRERRAKIEEEKAQELRDQRFRSEEEKAQQLRDRRFRSGEMERMGDEGPPLAQPELGPRLAIPPAPKPLEMYPRDFFMRESKEKKEKEKK
jgi:hypothetical protein